MKKVFLALSVSALLVGCAAEGPVHLGNGNYSLTVSDYWAWSGSGQQSEAVKKANEFCQQQNKVARITSMKATDAVAYQSVASGQVTFVCEDANQEVEPIEMAGGVYMLAGSSAGYQGIKARYELMKIASKFCKSKGLKLEMLGTTRETGQNYTSATGRTDTANSAENILQNTSADIVFRCTK